MARFVFGMNQSLDGYVDHMAFGPSPALFRHFIEQARAQAGSIYGASCTRSCVSGTRIAPTGARRSMTLSRRGGGSGNG